MNPPTKWIALAILWTSPVIITATLVAISRLALRPSTGFSVVRLGMSEIVVAALLVWFAHVGYVLGPALFTIGWRRLAVGLMVPVAITVLAASLFLLLETSIGDRFLREGPISIAAVFVAIVLLMAIYAGPMAIMLLAPERN